MRALLLLSLCAAACGIPDEGPQMRPGEDCMSCHDGRKATQWTVAGTLFADPKSGAGAGAEGVQVLVQDAAGRALTLTTNGAGNFYTAEDLKKPIKVQAQSGKTRMAMVAAPSSGSCNSCHAQPAQGDAPGRLFVPAQ